MIFYSLHMRGKIGSQLRSTTALHIGNSQSKLSLSSAPPWPLSYSSTRSSPLFSWEAIQILFSDWIVHHTQNWQTIVMVIWPWLLLKVLIVDWLVKQIDFQNTNPIEGNQTIRIIRVNRQSAQIFERWILLLSIAGHWLFYFNAHHQHHKHHHHLHNHDDHHQPLGDDSNSILGGLWPDRPWQLWAGRH